MRAAVWTANYPRNVLARITGRIVIVNALTVAASAALVGWTLEARFIDARWLYGAGAVAGLAGAWLYRAMRVRREFVLLAAEAAHGGAGEAFSLAMLRRILKEDPAYREYMLWMGVFGAGNLMLTAQLVLIFSEELHLSSTLQIGLLAVVPLLTQPLFLPAWARLFDGAHVVRYRARQGWALVLATLVFTLGVFAHSGVLLWSGAVLLGAAQAGANLGWNLGHNDFASIGRAQHYMGVHVTLTGLRGGFAPPLGRARLHGARALARGLREVRPGAAGGTHRFGGARVQPHACGAGTRTRGAVGSVTLERRFNRMKKKGTDPRAYSRVVFDGVKQTASRAMLRALGFEDADFQRPQIGVASTWANVTPCNMHIGELAREACSGVDAAGGKSVLFNTITVSDGISMGTPGMRYSLISREIIADSIEAVAGAAGFDGLVAIGGCDKNMPGCAMAIARLNRAAVFVYGGTIRPGDGRRDIVSVFEAVGAHAAGKLSAAGLLEIERTAIPGPGSCGGMYTANTWPLPSRPWACPYQAAPRRRRSGRRSAPTVTAPARPWCAW